MITRRRENHNNIYASTNSATLSPLSYKFIVSPKCTHITHVDPDNRQRQDLYFLVIFVHYVRNDSNMHVKLLYQLQVAAQHHQC